MEIFDPPAQKLGHGFAPPPKPPFSHCFHIFETGFSSQNEKNAKMRQAFGGGSNACAKMEFAKEIETKNVCENQTKFKKQ
jgi:hypothetical protein